MNTYEENLHNSVTETLETLASDAAALQREHLKAQFTLYHAKGAVLAAQDRLDSDQAHCEVRREANNSVQRTQQQAQNVFDTLTLVKQGIETTIGNVSTTTTNLQTSADAITQLASSVGATLNVASATLYGTELFHQIAHINDYLNQVANQACQLAAQSMNVSSKCAESIAGTLADQGNDVQTRLTELLAKTSDDLERSVQAVQTDRQQISDAAKTEFSANGALLDAAARSKAMNTMVHETIAYANFGLTIEVLSVRRIKVNFSAFKPPFPNNIKQGNTPHSKISAYIAIVPQNQASQFTNDQAAQLFGKWDKKSSAFISVQPGEHCLDLQQDVYGNPIRAGINYRAFLYLEPDSEYKRHLGNYADHISIASAPFIPLTTLPRALYGGESGHPRRLLLALADEGQDDDTITTEGIAPLFSGLARLESYLEWIRRESAQFDPSTVVRLEAVVPPFAKFLKRVIDAINTHDLRTATAVSHDAQKLLREMHNWQDLATYDTTQSTEIASLRSLLEELGTQLDQACATPTAPKRPRNSSGRVELRCILLDQNIDPSIAECAASRKFPDFFNLAIAEQVAPANYIVAKRLPKAPEGATQPVSLAGKKCYWYTVDIDDEATDSFGNPLLSSHSYTPFILAVANVADSNEWGNTLTAIDHAWQYA